MMMQKILKPGIRQDPQKTERMNRYIESLEKGVIFTSAYISQLFNLAGSQQSGKKLARRDDVQGLGHGLWEKL
jgi:hypothetical protein